MYVRGAHSSRERAPLVRATRLPQVALARSHPLPLPLHYAIRGDRRRNASRRRGVCFINNTSRVHCTTASRRCIDTDLTRDAIASKTRTLIFVTFFSIYH